MIWTNINGDADILRRLQEQIERETGKWRTAEQRTFQPHLTLARVRSLKPDGGAGLRDKIRAHTATHVGSWHVGQVDLMQSKLSSVGAEYSQLAEFPLE